MPYAFDSRYPAGSLTIQTTDLHSKRFSPTYFLPPFCEFQDYLKRLNLSGFSFQYCFKLVLTEVGLTEFYFMSVTFLLIASISPFWDFTSSKCGGKQCWSTGALFLRKIFQHLSSFLNPAHGIYECKQR